MLSLPKVTIPWNTVRKVASRIVSFLLYTYKNRPIYKMCSVHRSRVTAATLIYHNSLQVFFLRFFFPLLFFRQQAMLPFRRPNSLPKRSLFTVSGFVILLSSSFLHVGTAYQFLLLQFYLFLKFCLLVSFVISSDSLNPTTPLQNLISAACNVILCLLLTFKFLSHIDVEF